MRRVSYRRIERKGLGTSMPSVVLLLFGNTNSPARRCLLHENNQPATNSDSDSDGDGDGDSDALAHIFRKHCTMHLTFH
jgi:hypothetical protein